MSDVGSEVSGGEVSGSEVSEAEMSSDVSQGEMDNDLSQEVDECYDSYMNGDSEITFDKNTETNEVNETDQNKSKNPSPDNFESELNKKTNSYLNEKDLSIYEKTSENTEENSVEQIKCKNESLEGKRHPETDVPFERRQVEIDGRQYEVVAPVFDSFFDAKLSENMYKESDHKQFKECNLQLKNEIATNESLREKFDDEQLDQIENGEVPDGYTWHHDTEAGKMQLVDTETHQKTGHTGGRFFWGGGTENR